MQRTIKFDAQGLQLEGRLYEGQNKKKGAIITHPHPLYGGDMDNAVVDTLCRAYQEKGWSTLRFNFRGAGRSQGEFDHGQGEQDDVQAAIDFLLASGIHHIDLAGYSFGAWVLACWSQQRNHLSHPIYLVSPPVAFIEFPTGPLTSLKGVFTGGRDDLGPPDQIKSQLPQWGPHTQLTIIENADHFYQGYMDELQLVFSQLSGTI